MKTTPHMVIWTSAALFLGACGAATTADLSVQAEADAAKPVIETTRVALGPAVSTIKPGASVRFSHETSGPVPVDGTGYVTITVNEGYPYGTLELVASANSGLEVRGTSASHVVNMADGTAHSWRVDYQGLTDGVHYLNVMAVAKPTADAGEMRAYAVRVEVGDWKAVQAERDAAKPMEALADGEMAIMMQAEETIE
jgi:plastocyanin